MKKFLFLLLLCIGPPQIALTQTKRIISEAQARAEVLNQYAGKDADIYQYKVSPSGMYMFFC